MKKKLISLLVLLAAAVSGAWADNLYMVVDGTTATLKYGDAGSNPYFYQGEWNNLTDKTSITTINVDATCANFSGAIGSLFYRFSGLTTVNNIENLITANITGLSNTFGYCSSLQNIDLSSVNTSKVTNMSNMFENCSALTTLDLSSWDTGSLKGYALNRVFKDCSSLETIDLSSWTLGTTNNTDYMFKGCSSLKNIYVGDGWNLDNVTSSTDMFEGCVKLPGYASASTYDKSLVETGILKQKVSGGGYALTKEADAEAHGDIQFNVGEGENVKEDVTKAEEGDLVTVVITPDEGWVVNEVSGLWYANEAAARGLRRIAASPESLDMLKDFDLQFVSEDPETHAQTYTFEMKRAKAEISVSYKKLLNNTDITIENIADQTYTGQAIEPTITVKDGSTVLVQGTDYTITYSNNVNAALKTATENAPTVTITAVATSEKYAGETTKTFTINPAQLSDDMIAPIADKTYTGSGIEPALTITFGEGDNAQTLVKGTDFTVVYSNNVNVGVGTATVTGQGNFTGTASADFNIVAKALNKNMISPIDDLEYTGEPQEPGLDVNYNGNPLVEGTDYTAEYENNTEAGKATVTITGKGNYEGTATANFYIGRKDLNEDDMKVEYIYWEHYNGQKHTPQLTIRDGTKQLIEDKDYKVTFKNNVNAGTANVTIEGLGNYKGTVRKYFAIYSYVLNEDMVQAIADQTWTGEAVTPAISVINGNVTLTEGKDYTVKFKNNVNEGTATAIINGTGNFRSIDLVKTFKIVKKAEVTDPEAVEAPGEATAISGPAAAGSPAGTAYTLGGRKAKANRKGVVIIDGKLVLKK